MHRAIRSFESALLRAATRRDATPQIERQMIEIVAPETPIDVMTDSEHCCLAE